MESGKILIPLAIVRREGHYIVTMHGFSLKIWSYREELNVVFFFDGNNELIGAVNTNVFDVTISNG